MQPTLLVLAAGMGSRYGSLKQMDGVGPNNEAIIDYSIYDAIRAGFDRVVFVIRHSFEADFKAVFTPERFGGKVKIDFVYQELENIPAPFTVPADRVKPWGTNHAIMMAEGVIDTPFAVINADDFYGRHGYQAIADYLRTLSGRTGHYCMVGYPVGKTLSENGTVSRGVCTVDEQGNLLSIVERTAIARENGVITYHDEQGVAHHLKDNDPVSMNLFGFTPDYFKVCKEYFTDFLKNNMSNLKSEFYIPTLVNTLVGNGGATMKVLSTDDRWFGVTYKEDRPDVVKSIQALIDKGEYPAKLWE